MQPYTIDGRWTGLMFNVDALTFDALVSITNAIAKDIDESEIEGCEAPLRITFNQLLNYLTNRFPDIDLSDHITIPENL